MTQQFPDRMVARLSGGQPAAEDLVSSLPLQHIQPGRPPFCIEIAAADGTRLVTFREDERGYLTVEGDESRWDEGAKRFLHGMMQWSGQVGIRWKDEVIAAVEVQE